MIIPRRCLKLIKNDLRTGGYLINSLPTNSIKGIIDIGACYGIFSILARLLHPDSKILAVEPHPQSYASLVENTSNLGIDTLNVAYGNGKSFILEKERKTPLCNRYNLSDNLSDNIVKSYTLAQILHKGRMDPSLTLIKLDCEGAEKYLLEEPEVISKVKVLSFEVHKTSGLNLKDFFIKIHDILYISHHLSIVYSTSKLGFINCIKKDFIKEYNLKY